MARKIIELDEGWDYMVTNGIKKVIRVLTEEREPQFTSEEYMMLYTKIYDMCTQKPPYDFSQQLYEKYGDAFVDHMKSTVMPSLRETHDEFMLRKLVHTWSIHQVMVRWLSRFFNYLDRYFIARHSLTPLRELGLTKYKEHVYAEMNPKARTSLISLIKREREGEQIDRGLMQKVVKLFVEIGMESMDNMSNYEKDFEAHMISDTGEYYIRKASAWIVEDSCPEYMVKAEEALRKERARVSHYLHLSTEPKLVERVEKELLVAPCTQLIEKEDSGCRALLRGNRVEDLSRMFMLYEKIPQGLNPIATVFRLHVTNEGTNLLQQAEDAVATAAASGNRQAASEPRQVLISRIIELHDKYLGYVNDCFQRHSLFHKALKEAFEVFCNKPVVGSSSSAELLAEFCDTTLKKTTKKKSSVDEEAIDGTLDKVVLLLAYISDKDVFAEFSRKKLGRRLLFDNSNEASHDNERALLTKLKQQCGAQFTSKMEGMVTDKTLSKDTEDMSNFKEYLHESGNPKPAGVDMSVTVLTTGFWPSYKTSDCNLPEEMVKCIEVFKEFYESKKKHRKLSWIYSLGSCTVTANFGTSTKYELTLSTYQAALLLLFNTADRLTLSEILTQLNLTNDDVVRVLHSLTFGKYKILLKEPNSRTISASDTFVVNSKFSDKMKKIKVPLPPMVDERKKVTEDVEKDRRYAIDAALVRIMKSRKVLGHVQLVTECIEMLQRTFKPDMKTIKKRIEDLITRDYLERDPDSPNTFKYLA